jgi:hypothetical protein
VNTEIAIGIVLGAVAGLAILYFTGQLRRRDKRALERNVWLKRRRRPC